LYYYYAVALVLMFLAAIYVPFLGALLKDHANVSRLEKRTLAPLPSWPTNIQSVRLFPTRFADYYADHFGFRQPLVSWYKQLKYHLGDAPSQDVIVGREGWVFLGGIRKGYSRYGDPVGDARHVSRYSEAGLRQFSVYLSAVSYWLEKKGSRFLFVMAPNKHSIYPEYLPDYVKPVQAESAADQLFSHLRSHVQTPAVDLRPALRNAKEQGSVYFYRDSHWNYLGANHAQKAIREALSALFPGEIIAELFPMNAGVEREGDLNGYIGLLPQPRTGLVPDFSDACKPRTIPENAAPRDIHTNVCEGGRLRAIVFRDSFFTLLEPFFSRVFGRSTYIWTKLDMEVLKRLLEEEKPDVVIEEWVERELPRVPDPQPVLKKIIGDGMGRVYSVPLNRLRFNQRIRVLSETGKNVVLESTGVDPYILLPRLELLPASAYIVHVRLYSSVSSGLELYYSAGDSPDFSARRVLKQVLSKGENDVYFWLYAEEMRGYLRLDPLWAEGKVVLHSLDIIGLADGSAEPGPDGKAGPARTEQ
jgi:hypothetical protein